MFFKSLPEIETKRKHLSIAAPYCSKKRNAVLRNLKERKWDSISDVECQMQAR
jgi:hypothetical protein